VPRNLTSCQEARHFSLVQGVLAALAEAISKHRPQSFVLEDRPGGGSLVGTNAVAKAAPSGYTLRMMCNTHTVNESPVPSMPFWLLRDFAPIEEAGIPGYEATIWLGLTAPEGTPKLIIDKLDAAITRFVSQPDARAAWTRQGAMPMAVSPEEFERHLCDDIAKWVNVVKVARIRVDGRQDRSSSRQGF
jgi:tripartite-type tricarboxylate transporter receptor subunit TctC